MNIVKNLQENATGNIDCKLLCRDVWCDFTMSPVDKYEISEDSDWPYIKPCDPATKAAHEQVEAINQAVSSVQTMLDSEAASRGYDNINAIAKYMGYDNQFRAECEALGEWCAACWAKCYELQAGGVMPNDLAAEMPVLVV